MFSICYITQLFRLLCNPILPCPSVSLDEQIVQGEKDVLMEKRFSLKISRAKRWEKWEYNYFLSKPRKKMMHEDHDVQVKYFYMHILIEPLFIGRAYYVWYLCQCYLKYIYIWLTEKSLDLTFTIRVTNTHFYYKWLYYFYSLNLFILQ